MTAIEGDRVHAGTTIGDWATLTSRQALVLEMIAADANPLIERGELGVDTMSNGKIRRRAAVERANRARACAQLAKAGFITYDTAWTAIPKLTSKGRTFIDGRRASAKADP